MRFSLGVCERGDEKQISLLRKEIIPNEWNGVKDHLRGLAVQAGGACAP